jgi:hypothetical protein
MALALSSVAPNPQGIAVFRHLYHISDKAQTSLRSHLIRGQRTQPAKMPQSYAPFGPGTLLAARGTLRL